MAAGALATGRSLRCQERRKIPQMPPCTAGTAASVPSYNVRPEDPSDAPLYRRHCRCRRWQPALLRPLLFTDFLHWQKGRQSSHTLAMLASCPGSGGQRWDSVVIPQAVGLASMPVVQMLLIGLVGAYLTSGYCNVLTPDARKHMNKVVYLLFVSCLTFSSLAKTVTLRYIISWWFMPMNIGLIYLIGGTLGWITVKAWASRPNGRQGEPSGTPQHKGSKGDGYKDIQMPPPDGVNHLIWRPVVARTGLSKQANPPEQAMNTAHQVLAKMPQPELPFESGNNPVQVPTPGVYLTPKNSFAQQGASETSIFHVGSDPSITSPLVSSQPPRHHADALEVFDDLGQPKAPIVPKDGASTSGIERAKEHATSLNPSTPAWSPHPAAQRQGDPKMFDELPQQQ